MIRSSAELKHFRAEFKVPEVFLENLPPEEHAHASFGVEEIELRLGRSVTYLSGQNELQNLHKDYAVAPRRA